LKEHNVVFLLVGPRGAGKSTYAAKIVEHNPGSLLISRDAILIELFGSEHTDPYSGAGYYAMETLFDRLREKLVEKTGSSIVLDCWTGSSQERQYLVKKLRSYGASKIIALYFNTPLAFVEQWFWDKPGIAKMQDMRHLQGKGLIFYAEDAPKRDFDLFHEFAKNINDDGFDQVIQINPLEEPITLS